MYEGEQIRALNDVRYEGRSGEMPDSAGHVNILRIAEETAAAGRIDRNVHVQPGKSGDSAVIKARVIEYIKTLKIPAMLKAEERKKYSLAMIDTVNGLGPADLNAAMNLASKLKLDLKAGFREFDNTVEYYSCNRSKLNDVLLVAVLELGRLGGDKIFFFANDDSPQPTLVDGTEAKPRYHPGYTIYRSVPKDGEISYSEVLHEAPIVGCS